jgi:signal transduction histidine kinase
MPAEVGRIRLRQALVLLTGAAVGAESAHLAFQATWYAFGSTSRWSAMWGLFAGAAVVATGVILLGSPRNPATGMLLAAAGITWMLTVWDNPAAPAGIFLLGRVLGTVWPVLVAHSLLRRFGSLNRSERAVLTLAYASTVGVEGLAEALVFNPATNGCTDCPANPLLLVDAPGAAARLEQAATLAGPIWAVLLITTLAIRLVRSTPARRRLVLPIIAVGMTLLALVAAGYLRAAARRLPETDDVVLWAAEAGLLLMLCLAAGWPAIALARTRHRLAHLVVQASAVPPIGGLGRMIGTVLQDPTARLLYPQGELTERELIDADGGRAEPRAELTPLTRGSDIVAYLDHRSPLLDHDTALIAQVAQLSLDNERLHAERTAQLRELRASRVRIVEEADRERRRLERDLHDGAQQRLVSLALGLRLADVADERPDSPVATVLAEAEAEIAAALTALRAIARGLYPRELADEGLAAALETFAESDPTPVDLELDLPARARSDIESGAYFAVAHFLATPAYDPGSGRAIRAWQEGEQLHLDLAGSIRSDDLTLAEDRVRALGGTVQLIGTGSIRIELPCAS